MTIKKIEGQIVKNPFSLNIAELSPHLNGEKKNYLLVTFF